MGMDADVIGIGPITKEIRECNGLDYGKERYEDLPIGTIITSRFFNCVTTGMSHELADAFGIDPFDFARHLLSGWPLTNFDWVAIQRIAENEQPAYCAESEVECFKACHRAGWTLIYRPNF